MPLQPEQIPEKREVRATRSSSFLRHMQQLQMQPIETCSMRAEFGGMGRQEVK